MNVVVQKLKKANKDEYELAERYYGIISSLNSLKMTQREIQLVAYTAIRGNISYTSIKEDFCKRCNTSIPTINNIISRLRKIDVLIKDNGKIKVHPAIALKFSQGIVLQITLPNG
jgi:RNase P subunit RPR2